MCAQKTISLSLVEEVKRLLRPFIDDIERTIIDTGDVVLYNGIKGDNLPYRRLACLARKYGLSPGRMAELVRDILGNAVGVEILRRNISLYYYVSNGGEC